MKKCCASKKPSTSTLFWIILSAVFALALIFKSGSLASALPFLGVLIEKMDHTQITLNKRLTDILSIES